MRHGLIGLCMMLCSLSPAYAQLSISFSTPGVSIGINLPVYPQLQRVPGYPVYYAPGVNSNYFFYDGMYWVYQGDNWYASSWYNGPWGHVDHGYVPDYLLRVPVRYYRQPPTYFRGWASNKPPRWGEHWGRSWEQNRSGWDRWDRKAVPAPAPLPTYQRQYSGNRYPQAQQQSTIQTQQYRYQPRDPVAQQHYQQQRAHENSSRGNEQDRGRGQGQGQGYGRGQSERQDQGQGEGRGEGRGQGRGQGQAPKQGPSQAGD